MHSPFEIKALKTFALEVHVLALKYLGPPRDIIAINTRFQGPKENRTYDYIPLVDFLISISITSSRSDKIDNREPSIKFLSHKVVDMGCR